MGVKEVLLEALVESLLVAFPTPEEALHYLHGVGEVSYVEFFLADGFDIVFAHLFSRLLLKKPSHFMYVFYVYS